MLRRRGFFGLAAALLAAPAVVQAKSIMPVRCLDVSSFYPTVGYRGMESFDAAAFYCPYIPLQYGEVTREVVTIDPSRRTLSPQWVRELTQMPSVRIRTRYDG